MSKLSEEKIKRLKDLMCSAFEGGSNYWYLIQEHNVKEVECEFIHEVPFHKDGFLIISDIEDDEGEEVWKLDFKAITKGYTAFKNLEADWHYKNFINEDDDAETGDVFLQCCLFGKVVYG